ncbi:MAG: type I DNA topoisomerase [Anaerovoracaceae bacterium]|nr:type I DNA topoisomerase [Anaerovoracaceae bacterium]
MAAAKKILVIVESPSKAKTIGKFLGGRYKVIASVGHVRDLPKSKLGIDIENDFEPQYISIRGKGDIIKELKKEAKNASKVYLATDPDREGEAISWHLAFLLGIDPDAPCRIVFNEITERAIKEAIKNPRPIDLSLVDAQQARRVLDRLVGYQISPLLWRKVRRGLSAGRVQSAALKIICDRENEIKNFKPQEFWTITAEFSKKKKFTARLTEYRGEKILIENKEKNDAVLEELKKGEFVVKSLEEKDRTRRAAAPFTTSSLQQDAANKLNFSTRKTMMIAQQLYEGIEVKGRGTIGLVSYIRTDSVRISDEARAASREFIVNTMGEQYYGNNVYKNRKKDVQDAHEAIRPSYVELEPESVKESLSRDQYKLYSLIWNRFVASQMAPAKFKALSVVIANGDYDFKANGSKMLFDGFLKVYSMSKDDEADRLLPDMEKGEVLQAVDIEGQQNFTQPPARFTEASLVKDLEEKDIGRPSTYAPIVATLTDRKYISKEKKSLIPTELGFIVTDMMEQYFKEIVDAGFTAQMEENLDDIETKGVRWKSVIEDFYDTLKDELKTADEQIEKVEFKEEPTGELCEKCGKPMVIKHGRFGDFVACTGYPECKNTKPIVKTIDVKCPKCGKDIVVRKSRKGRIFYGCSGYPDCDQVFWNKPVNKKCPKCGSLLVEKKGKDTKYACSNSECDYRE